jgi:cytochrome P450
MAVPPELKVHRSVTKALKRFDADRLQWLDAAAAEGPLVALRLGPVTTWVVTDPEIARTILVNDSSSWTRPPATRAPIRVGVGENLFSQTDKAWARVQPLVAPAFRKRALEPRLAEIDAMVDDEVRAIPLDTNVDLELVMGEIALRVAAWVLLGERLDRSRSQELAHHQREVVRWIGTQLGAINGFLPVAFGRRAREMKRHRAVLGAYADEVVARARTRRAATDDVLGALLEARPSGKALSPTQLRGHVLGLLLAGNETTASALSWILVRAALEPDEWARVRAEPAMRTEPFITETLRLNPAVWGIPRTPTRAGVTLTAGGVTARVRRGQLATIYVRGINRDPTLWDDPLRFDPSRHDLDAKEQQRALIPFGLGPRGCIGQHLAMAELRAIVPALARRGDVTVDGPITEDASFALRVGRGLHGSFLPVRDPASES